MDPNWNFVILVGIFWTNPQSASGTSTGNFILVSGVPGAASLITVPFVFQKQHCATKCLHFGPCQGFLMVATEVHPCQLLIGLDGSRAPLDPNIEAFITLYYDGVPHDLVRSSLSWIGGLALCQSMGKTMISYPVSMDKRNWLVALNDNMILIGAKKEPNDNNRVYDINTNSLVTVDWLTDGGDPPSNIMVLFPVGKFVQAKDFFKFNDVTLVCAPVS